MAKKKGLGSTKNVHDSPGKRLGVKVFGGQQVKTGNIIIRQRGTNKISGPGTKVGKDHTIYAAQDGTVEFKKKKVTRFSGHKVPRTEVRVV